MSLDSFHLQTEEDRGCEKVIARFALNAYI